MTAGGGWSRTDYIGGLRPSRSKARAWRGVGSVGRSKRYFGLLGRLTLLRARVARSARRLRKLCTGIPSSVRREVALRMAAGERLAGATMETHLFRPERAIFTPGDQLVVVETASGVFCADKRANLMAAKDQLTTSGPTDSILVHLPQSRARRRKDWLSIRRRALCRRQT